MRYRIAICDDSEADSGFVSGLVEEWARAREVFVQKENFSSAEAFLFRYAEDKAWDILLLDIEMGGMDGVTMSKRLRRENDEVQIVFITGYSEYIADGYEVAALHYLLKPVNRDKFFAVLDRAVEKLLKNENVLNLSLAGEMVRIPMREIRYLDVYQNYVTVHAVEDLKVRRPLGEFEELLDERFFRVGRGLIVNLDYIRRVTRGEVHLSDGSVLPLPRGGYEAINRAIIEHS